MVKLKNEIVQMDIDIKLTLWNAIKLRIAGLDTKKLKNSKFSGKSGKLVGKVPPTKTTRPVIEYPNFKYPEAPQIQARPAGTEVEQPSVKHLNRM